MPTTTAALDKIRRTRARAMGLRDGIEQGGGPPYCKLHRWWRAWLSAS